MNHIITQLNLSAFHVPLLSVSFLEPFGKAEYFPKGGMLLLPCALDVPDLLDLKA